MSRAPVYSYDIKTGRVTEVRLDHDRRPDTMPVVTPPGMVSVPVRPMTGTALPEPRLAMPEGVHPAPSLGAPGSHER